MLFLIIREKLSIKNIFIGFSLKGRGSVFSRVTTTATRHWERLRGPWIQWAVHRITGWAAVLWVTARTTHGGHMGGVPVTLRGAPGLTAGGLHPGPTPAVQTEPSLEAG